MVNMPATARPPRSISAPTPQFGGAVRRRRLLAALVRGLAYLRAGQPGEGPPPIEPADSIHRLLGETHLEGLLQAVAAEPGLIAEMRLLLAPTGGTEFERLCDDLDVVARQLRLGVTP